MALMTSSADWLVFQYLVTMSCNSPPRSGETRMAASGRWRDESFMTSMPAWAQMSIAFESTSVRTGIEPFLLLKATWAAGEVIVVASRCCDLMAAGSEVFGNTNTSPAMMYGDFGPKPGKQPNSLPAVCLAVENSPLAQSPMICTPALPLITIEVASFQFRLGEPASV